MPLFSTTQPSIRARILSRFPANVLAGAGISITRQGGSYVFSATTPVDIPISALEDVPQSTLIGRAQAGIGPPTVLTASGGLVFTGADGVQLSENQRSRSFTAVFNSPTAGAKQDFLIPLSCSVTRVTLLADQAGDVVVDVYKTDFAGFPGSAANSICAAAKPSLAAALKYQDAVLTGWSKDIVAGDIIRLNIDSVATITRLSVSLEALTI